MKKYAIEAKKLLTQLNCKIKLSNDGKHDDKYFEEIFKHINNIQILFEYDKLFINKIFLSDIKKQISSNLYFLVQNKQLYAILTKDYMQNFIDNTVINTDLEFIKVIEEIGDDIVLDLLDQSYINYTPTLCYVLIFSKNKLYIINFSKLYNKIGVLLNDKFCKIFASLDCYHKFYYYIKIKFKNFYIIKNNNFTYNMKGYQINNKTYIDWKIPGICKILRDYLHAKILNVSKQIKYKKNYFKDNLTDDDFLYTYRDTKKYFHMWVTFLNRNSEWFKKLLLIRDDLAKKNDKSIYYIMTNKQLLEFHDYKFNCLEDIYNNNIKISSLIYCNIKKFLYK